MSELLRQIVRENRAGGAVAIPSVCSAHAGVIRACLSRAGVLGQPIVVEATSNQVNQDGGYTGQRADEFIAMVRSIACEIGLDPALLAFGGDHLGPQVWRGEIADAAMAKADKLVRDYVEAGFTKIHLDCSEGCKGEEPVQGDEVTAARSALLARACVDVAKDPDDLVFVIGTEVPPPGGARTDGSGDIPPTEPNRARATLEAHANAFERAGVSFANVAGLVVQPGVEFTPMFVHHFPKGRVLPYNDVLADWPGIVLEVHSTDYQHPWVFPALARQGFAFQKVGPALTFGWRQAVYALDMLRGLVEGRDGGLVQVLESAMTENPDYWTGHYRGTAAELFAARHFGLADRIRYYWPRSEVQAALADLRSWVDSADLPDPMLLQMFPEQVLIRAAGLDGPLMRRLLDASVEIALDPYFVTDPAQQERVA